ncbi:hypothetical protein [Streptomyces sp. I8-5]|uniref:hypothetical protein n=1 Tax=Streptomyces sp. I8-5 TaxID=3104277 RepID=UPI003866A153
MSGFDDWPWGYCHRCDRDIVTVTELVTDGGTKQVLSHHTTQRLGGSACRGSGLPPSAPQPELTAEQEQALLPPDTVDYSAEGR